MESFSSASYSKWDDDRAWSSQEWKTDIETYERSGRLDNINSQEKAWLQQIRHWKQWSTIGIVSRINIIRESGEWAGAKKTEKDFGCCRKWRKTFCDLGNVHDCNNGISSSHGKETPEQLSIRCKYNRSHTQTNLRHIYEIGVWARWDLRIGNDWLEKTFMEISVIDWWRKNHQSSAYEGLRLFGFCVVLWEDFRKSRI